MLKQKFCPKCGKKGITGDFCDECNPVTIDIDIDNHMTVCAECKKYNSYNKWTKYSSLKDAIVAFVKNQFEKRGKVHVQPDIPKHTINEGVNIEFDIVVTISTESYKLPFKLSYTLCPKCSKKGTGYFEGILQLRNPSKYAIEYIEHEAKKDEERGVYINKKQKVRGGVDFYISKNSFIKKIQTKVQSVFGGEIKIAPKLFTMNTQTSKRVYRLNALINLPDFNKGDVLVVKNRVYQVISHGKKANLLDLVLDKKKAFDYKNIKFTKLKKYTTHVTKIYPTQEVLNPETYESDEIINRPKTKIRVNQKVTVAIHDGIYIV